MIKDKFENFKNYSFNNKVGKQKIKNALMDINDKRNMKPQKFDIHKRFFKQFRSKFEEKFLNDPNIGIQKKKIVHSDKL